jgi:long-subunit acyl-CoA synthetase (AMP-forming)
VLFTYKEPYKEHCKEHHREPTQVAISDFNTTKTWQELNERCLRLANFLIHEKNLQANDHIALLVGNCVEFIEVVLASILSGLWVTPINTHLLAEEINYIFNDSDAKFIFFDNDHEHLLDEKIKQKGLNVENISQLLLDYEKNLQQSITLDGPAGGTML